MDPERSPSEDLEVERMYATVRGRLFRRRAEPVTLGRYEVLDRIGAGGMGMVYAGRDPQLDRRVALKLIRPERVAASEDLQRSQDRLLREAQAMARVSSPFVVTVYEAGVHGRQVFVAMEFVDGRTLTRWLAAHSRPWRDTVEVFIQAGKGLAAVHEAGLVHRDFKPDNVLIGNDGRARVADFGLASAAGASVGAASSRPKRSGGPSGTTCLIDRSDTLTRTGAIVGSLAYMSPEQHRREPVDARSDQFAFCVALFEALVGRRPFGDETADGLRREVLAGAVDWREAGKLPDRILRLLRRGLALEPEQRWEGMAAVVAELERAAHPRRRWLLVGGALALVAGSVAATSSLHAGDGSLCDRAAAEAHTAWGVDRRAAVDAALRGTDRAFAERTARQVADRLDEHARSWTSALVEVCTDGRDPGRREPDFVRLACLERTAVEAEALTRALSEDPERFVEHATLAVYKLRTPSSCANSTQLWFDRGPDLASGKGAMPVFAALARAEARLFSADVDGIEDAQRALTLARSGGEPAYEAEALLLRGVFFARAGTWDEAEADLLAANDLAERIGAWDVAVRARTELVFVVGYRQQRFGEARVWSRLAESALARAAAGGLVEVRLLNAQGLVFGVQGLPDQARASLEKALMLARANLGPDHPGLAATLENLGRLELQDEALRKRAREYVGEAHEIRSRTLGPTHPDTVRTAALLRGP